VTSLVFNEAFEHGHAQVEVQREIVDCRVWAELLMISNKNEMLCVFGERCDDVCFENFCCFFYNHDRYFYPLEQVAILGAACSCHSNDIGLLKKNSSCINVVFLLLSPIFFVISNIICLFENLYFLQRMHDLIVNLPSVFD
jgi:hypothetical protein